MPPPPPQKSRRSKRKSSRRRYGSATPGKTRSGKRVRRQSFSAEQLRDAGVETEEQALKIIHSGFKDSDLPTTISAPPSDTSVEMAAQPWKGIRIPRSVAELMEYSADKKFKESWRVACWMHLDYKVDKYQRAELQAVQELNMLKHKLDMKNRDMGMPSEEEWRTLSEDAEYNSLSSVCNQYKLLSEHCRQKMKDLESGGYVATLFTLTAPLEERVAEFRTELSNFAANMSKQPEIADFVARLLLAFFQNPLFARNKFFSMVLAGPPGTGKSTIAQHIGKLLIKSGLFEGEFAEKGKPDFIGQYLGQTPHITKKTLTGYALDGVLLIDEAYSLCNLDETTGRVDMYGSEFATALVDFMTRYKGMSCIITAGYEPEMRLQFMGANDGIPRRFPHRFLLRPFNNAQLVDVFREKQADVGRPLSAEAESRISEFIRKVRSGKQRSPYLKRVLEAQAGAAANLSEFVSLYKEGRNRQRFFKAPGGVLSTALVRGDVQKEGLVVESKDVDRALEAVLTQAEMSEQNQALEDLERLWKEEVK